MAKKKPKNPDNVRRGKRAHAKGGEGEREVIKLFARMGFKGKRRPQYRGGTKDGPDVRCVHHTGFAVGVESKLQQSISVHAVIKQAVESVQDGREFPIGYMRRNREKGIIVMPAETFVSIFNHFVPSPPMKVGWKKRPLPLWEQAARSARAMIYRLHLGGKRHEQDLIDAKKWVEKFDTLCRV